MKTLFNRLALLLSIAVLNAQCKKDKEQEKPLPGTKNEWIVLSKDQQYLYDGSWAFTYGNKIYAFSDPIIVYDILQKKWTAETVPLPDEFECQSQSMITQFNKKIYIAGGREFDGDLTDQFWEFDPAKLQWKRLANLPRHLWDGSMFVHKNNVYIAFAEDARDRKKAQKKMYTYSLSTNSWSDNIVELNINGGTNGIFFQKDEQIYFGGGYGGDAPANPTTFYQYDLNTKSLKELASLPRSIIHTSQPFCFIVNNKGYAIDDGRMVIYDIVANSWQLLDNAPADDQGNNSIHSFLLNNRIITILGNGVVFEYL